MKRLFFSMASAVMLFLTLPLPALAAEQLIPVGKTIGIQLYNDAVTIAAYDDTLGHFAREAGLKIGDEILMVDDTPITSAQDVRDALSTCGESLALTIRRGSKVSTLQLSPRRTEEGARLGVYLRQGIAGIGTVTFYDPETGLFGTLGHGVSDNRGSLLEMTGGSACEAAILSVKKGKVGDPGQLKGEARDVSPCGQLLKNTPQGVFGINPRGWSGETLPIAGYDQIETGTAAIRCQVSGSAVQDYSVEILKIYPETRSDCRNFLLKVTDPALLEATGGIVQGMSGSPICQNGKIVGAVTHVLVNDPTMGYGIYIGNMLEAAA